MSQLYTECHAHSQADFSSHFHRITRTHAIEIPAPHEQNSWLWQCPRGLWQKWLTSAYVFLPSLYLRAFAHSLTLWSLTTSSNFHSIFLKTNGENIGQLDLGQLQYNGRNIVIPTRSYIATVGWKCPSALLWLEKQIHRTWVNHNLVELI